MPLIDCPDCSSQVSDMAPACLHCGRPIAEDPQTKIRSGPNLQRIVAYCLVGVGGLAVAAEVYSEYNAPFLDLTAGPTEPFLVAAALRVAFNPLVWLGLVAGWWLIRERRASMAPDRHRQGQRASQLMTEDTSRTWSQASGKAERERWRQKSDTGGFEREQTDTAEHPLGADIAPEKSENEKVALTIVVLLGIVVAFVVLAGIASAPAPTPTPTPPLPLSVAEQAWCAELSQGYPNPNSSLVINSAQGAVEHLSDEAEYLSWLETSQGSYACKAAYQDHN